MKKILVIGSNSDTAKATMARLEKDHIIVKINRSIVDLADATASEKIRNLLAIEQPDVVIHCAGVFDVTDDFDTIFDINVKSHWAVIKYYFDNPPNKLIRFIQHGSSTYKQGRRKWPLYAASRAAQHSMWQGANEAAPENFKLGIVHPVRVNTKHVAHLPQPNPELCLEPDDVAAVIEDMARNMTESYCVDMDYKKPNNANES